MKLENETAALMREAADEIELGSDEEHALNLAHRLSDAAASLESAEPVAFQFGARQQYVANHWPPENPDAPGVSPLYRHPPSAPEGYVLVPVEPTPEMLDALLCTKGVVASYKAMLTASPEVHDV